MSYPIEVRLASKNGYHTPAEARSYYGKYNRHGLTVHWWNTPSAVRDSDHDNIVNYILNKAAAGTGSVNYVLSNNKITLLVNSDNVAWASQGGNPTTISVEFSPHLNDEGYKKGGWLIWQLELKYNTILKLYPHNYWFGTQCPGHLSLDRLRQEANKWRNGGYNPAPTPPPTPNPPAKAKLTWTRWKEGTITYVTNKQPTKLWNFDQTTWAGFGNGVKDFNKGEQINIVGEVINETLNAKYLLTDYSFSNKITHGFNAKDLEVYVPPRPIPEPPKPDPTPPPPYKPEWEANLRDIDETKYYIKDDTELIDIITGRPVVPAKVLEKDEEFVASALTIANGVEYRITEYSFKKGIFNGVPISKLSLVPPSEPTVPPVPENPDLVDKNIVIAFLEGLVKAIGEFITRLRR